MMRSFMPVTVLHDRHQASARTQPPTAQGVPVAQEGALQLQRFVGNRAAMRISGRGAGRAGNQMAVVQEHTAEGVHLAVLQRADGPAEQALPKKKVSSKAMQRIEQAKAAIKHTKQVMMYGAGNQAAALKATQFNSYFRLEAMPRGFLLDADRCGKADCGSQPRRPDCCQGSPGAWRQLWRARRSGF